MTFKDSVATPGKAAHNQIAGYPDARVNLVFHVALNGYAAQLSPEALEEVKRDPRVVSVTHDHRVEVASQAVPTGVARISAPSVPALDIDETDDIRVNVDVAVIDSGILPGHPDLNVVARTNCVGQTECVDGTGGDGRGHGTHVAGTIAALDNDFGVVGVAPGARLHAVRVLGDDGLGWESWIIAGVDWVTAHADEIEVANMSLGCVCTMTSLDTAISASVDAGVVYTVAAGNDYIDAANFSPANNSDVITVSAISDYDGLSGGLSPETTCGGNLLPGPDDMLASFSNWGSTIEVAAPGSCILSTYLGNGYASLSGTSMAAPHVAGAAAILASESNPESQSDVEAIRQNIIKSGSLNWTDEADDGVHEPLLDLRVPQAEAVTVAASNLTTYSAKLNGVINPGGAATTYRFEYGATTAYGASAPVSPGSVGAGSSDVAVSETISVQPESVYHYRVVATNGAGTVYGNDKTFKTSIWSIDQVPNPQAEGMSGGKLYAVSCAESSACMGVGEYAVKAAESSGYHPEPFAERWDGSKWAITVPPLPSGGSEGTLEDASCATANACVAVGSFLEGNTRKALAEHWNGSQWSTTAVPSPPEAKGAVELKGVSCVSAAGCVAVGRYVSKTNFLPSLNEWRTLVAVWNGSSWAIQSSPSPEATQVSGLSAVSCSATTACLAVGSSKASVSKPASSTLIERWDGSNWTIQSSPNPAGTTERALEDVSCIAANQCLAVGNTNSEKGSLANQPAGFTVTWDGSGWQIDSSGLPNPILGASCSSDGDCRVAGGETSRHWNGTEWIGDAFAIPPAGSQVQLRDVSCISGSSCVAAGHYYHDRRGLKPLAQRLSTTDQGTTFCSTSERPCARISRLPAGAFVANSTNATITNTIGNVSCTNSKISGQTVASSGDPLPITISLWSLEGCKMPSGTKCTVSELGRPSSGSIAWTQLNAGVVRSGNGGWKLACGFLINCQFTADMSMDASNGSIQATAEPLNRSGGFCPASASFTATYQIASPFPAYIAPTEQPTTTFCKVDERICAEGDRYAAGTAIAGSASVQLKSTTAWPTMTCSSNLSGEVGATGSWSLPVTITGMSLSGCSTPSGTTCTATAKNLSYPGSAAWTSGHNGTWAVEDTAAWQILCGLQINCIISFKEPSMSITGGATAQLAINAKGESNNGFCLGSPQLIATYSLTSPSPLYVAHT